MNKDAAHEIIKRLMKEELDGGRIKPFTKKMILKDQDDYFIFLEDKDIRDIGKRDIVAYHQHLCMLRSKKNGELLSHDTVNARFRNATRLFSVMYRSGLIAENPCHNLNLDIIRRDGIRRRPLTREEITEFLEQLDTEERIGLRDRALFELIYSSGLRVAEAVSLKMEDMNLDRREIIVRGKGDRDRLVPISKLATAFLERYLEKRETPLIADHVPCPWVFPGRNLKGKERSHLQPCTLSERFRDLLRRFDMDKKEISTHSIRHSTATHLLENGASVRHVQELLGHKNIETTVRYTHMMIDGLSKVYRKYHPREHELFEAVDDDYYKRIETIIPVHGKNDRRRKI